MKPIRVAIYGVGQIGAGIARLLLQKPGLQVVGAVDAAPEKVGRDLGQVLGLGQRLGLTIVADGSSLFSKTKVDIVVHSTGSYLKQAQKQLEQMAQAGADVVSTCEELAYPYISHPTIAQRLHRLARKHGVSILGTGINPGFVMDTLPIVLSGVCQDIRRITVTRVLDASSRRPAFQRKIGAALTPAKFEQKMEEKAITGHVGLEQSIAMIASALGWKLDAIRIEQAQPVIAFTPVASSAVRVEPGNVSGLKQRAEGVLRGEAVIVLEFQAYLGAEQEYDAIKIEGTPPVYQKITPCLHGDAATIAIIANSIPKVIAAPPGLLTMKDLPIPSAVLCDVRECIPRLGQRWRRVQST